MKTLKNRMMINGTIKLDFSQIDFSKIEARTLTVMAVQSARDEIARRAGVKSADVDVFFSHDDKRPPTFQRVDKYNRAWSGRGPTPKGRTTHKRRVIVGREWLRTKAPELWAVFVAARLLGCAAAVPSQAPEIK